MNNATDLEREMFALAVRSSELNLFKLLESPLAGHSKMERAREISKALELAEYCDASYKTYCEAKEMSHDIPLHG